LGRKSSQNYYGNSYRKYACRFGTGLQGLFKNPLATGDLIGLTSGATLLAAIAIVLGGILRVSS
jgi:ABC-type cobalamin transport system permease subunit